MEGTVKWYNLRKGFGFIKGEDDQDYFVHHSALETKFIRDNDLVSFEPVETDKGKQAQKVNLLKKGSEIAGGSAEAPKESSPAGEKPVEAPKKEAPVEQPKEEEPAQDSESFGE